MTVGQGNLGNQTRPRHARASQHRDLFTGSVEKLAVDVPPTLPPRLIHPGSNSKLHAVEAAVEQLTMCQVKSTRVKRIVGIDECHEICLRLSSRDQPLTQKTARNGPDEAYPWVPRRNLDGVVRAPPIDHKNLFEMVAVNAVQHPLDIS